MKETRRRILTINGGSSSIKFALFDANRSLRLVRAGCIERIGGAGARLLTHAGDERRGKASAVAAADHDAAAGILMDWIAEQEGGDSIIGIGHRIVHGGPDFCEPAALSAAMLRALRALVPLDPQHLPDQLLLAEVFMARYAHLPHVACFDTAFHHDLPRVARLLPIPRRYEAHGVRRYGFHGLSYEYLMGELARVDGAAAAQGRIILAHLGNGASLAAVAGGRPVDTSMGFTPASGLPMSTRSGDLDPGLAGYFARTEGMDSRQFNDMVNFECGLLGVSETSADMRDLLALEAQDARAADAVALFCYQVRKWIGAFAAALGGLDTLVFAGGIGENAAEVRMRVCEGLGFIGIELDALRNKAGSDRISAASSRVKVRVMRTDEALVIARAVERLLGGGAADTQPLQRNETGAGAGAPATD